MLSGALGGRLAALAKALIEWTKLAEASRLELSVLLWLYLLHPVTFLMHRFLFRRPAPVKAKAV